MTRPIGYYVHHHGDGHRQRALAVAACAPQRFVLLGSGLRDGSENIAAIDLPDDRMSDGTFDGDDREANRSCALHYAPLRHYGVRARMTAIANWIANGRPGLIVADVSVEVALLARLCATPVAYVRLSGTRDDAPHLEAFRAASVLIAPFAEALDDPATPLWIRRKTVYAPGIIRRRVDAETDPDTVLVVCGRGGSGISSADLIGAAQATPQVRWRVIGLSGEGATPPNLVFAGWTDEPELEIARAGIVVGGAGDGVVGAVLAARKPFVCIPELRPFAEQAQKAAALERAGAAVGRTNWPQAGEWGSVLQAAQGINPARQAALDDPLGALRLSALLIELADRQK